MNEFHVQLFEYAFIFWKEGRSFKIFNEFQMIQNVRSHCASGMTWFSISAYPETVCNFLHE